MKRLRQTILAASLALLPAAASAGSLSDLWFDPAEPGWGANVVLQDDVGFVTLFVYGPDREPTWFVASEARVVAWSAEGLPHLRGALYRARGPHFAGPFDPSTVQLAIAGELAIEPLGTARARVTYRIGDVQVTKVVTRQTWRLPSPANAYDARFVVNRLGGGPSVERLRYSAVTTLTLANSVATLSVQEPAGRCDYTGAYEQAGRFGVISGGFHCEDGRAGPFTVRDVELTANGLSGRIEASWSGGSMNGRFAGPRS